MTILYNATAEDLEIRVGLFTSTTFDHQGVLHSARARAVQEPLGAPSGYPAILRLPPAPLDHLYLPEPHREPVCSIPRVRPERTKSAGRAEAGNLHGVQLAAGAEAEAQPG